MPLLIATAAHSFDRGSGLARESQHESIERYKIEILMCEFRVIIYVF
jgi:hypothetical protein